LLPRGRAEAGVVLEAEVALIGGENVVAVRVQHRGPTDHRRVAVRVEAVDDDHAGRVVAVQRKLAEQRRSVAGLELNRTEPRGPCRRVEAAGNRTARVVLRRSGVENAPRGERRVAPLGDVLRLVGLREDLADGGAVFRGGVGRRGGSGRSS